MGSKHVLPLIDYFNGSLSDDGKRRFKRDLESMHSVQEELKELETLTAYLPYLSEPVSPIEGMKERILVNVIET